MNVKNLNNAIDGQLAKYFEAPVSDEPLTEQGLRALGLEEKELPKDTADAIKSYADKLKKQGKRPRAIRREVARKFNITILA